MESEGLQGVCEQLRQEVAAELVTGPGKRWRCPAGLKPRIVSYARVCRERGEPLHEISARLGLVEFDAGKVASCRSQGAVRGLSLGFDRRF